MSFSFSNPQLPLFPLYSTDKRLEYPHYNRVDPHNMPSDLYEYERFYLAPVKNRTDKETPERYRQRAFAMYCWQGTFPRILKAYATQREVPVGLTGCKLDESFKKTGDYHIFRSEVSADGKKFAPVEVICVSFPQPTHVIYVHTFVQSAESCFGRISSNSFWYNY